MTPCKHCGYCEKCGRSDYVPYTPVQPWTGIGTCATCGAWVYSMQVHYCPALPRGTTTGDFTTITSTSV